MKLMGFKKNKVMFRNEKTLDKFVSKNSDYPTKEEFEENKRQI